MPKLRLDVLLVERGLAESRAKAQALIMAGQVRVADQVALRPATTVESNAKLTIDSGPRFVSRGGEKLDAALETFGINVSGLVCADVGASTGGFTDCMLQRGALKVYAIDVGKGLLHWKLRNDKRVVLMEQTNARYVKSLPEDVDLVTIDASFISLKKLVPVIKQWINESTKIVCLIKPQFEAGKKEVSRGDGVIRDSEIHRQVLLDVLRFARQEGFHVFGLFKSPLLGPKGNAEFFVWLSRVSVVGGGEEISQMVDQVL